MIETELLRYGYLFILVGSLLQPDATLLTAAFLSHRGYFRLSLVLLITVVGTVIASQIYFAIARRSGMKWLEKKASPKIEKIVAWSRSHGALLLLSSHFMSGFRTVIPVICGATGMPPMRFAFWNAIGVIVWTAVFGFTGYLGGHAFTLLLDDIRLHEKTIAACLAVLVAGAIIWRTQNRELSDTWTLLRIPRIDS